MFKSVSAKDIILIICLISFIGLTAHFVLIDRMGFWRLVYPFQAYAAASTIHCTEGSPVWMKSVLRKIISDYGSLGNQISHTNSKQKSYICTSGWYKESLISRNITPFDRFKYASVTKIFTADAILDLINQKKISLDTKIVKIFGLKPPFKDDKINDITIAHLLQHRSGFDRMRSEDVMFKYDHLPWCPYRLNEISRQKLDFIPNKRTAYDNRNYCLLGAVIEKITGKKYRDWIIERYQLIDVGIEFSDGFYKPDEVQYHFRNVIEYSEDYYKHLDFYALSSSAGLSGSASALSAQVERMLGRKPLSIVDGHSDKKCDELELNNCLGYALNIYKDRKIRRPMYFREGYLPAVSTLVAIDDCQGVTAILSNGASFSDISNSEFLKYLVYNEFYGNSKKTC